MKNYLILLGLVCLAVSCSKTDLPGPTLIEQWSLIILPDRVNGIEDIDFSDENFGVATGANGTFIKTVDGGSTWEKKEVLSGSRLAFRTCAILNENEFFVSRSLVYKTEDGGNMFSEYTERESANTFSFEFVNTTTGFLSRSGKIYKTEDAGSSWNMLFNTGPDTYNTFPAKLKFASERVGFFYGGSSRDGSSQGRLYITTDGGENWIKKEEVDSEIIAMSFVNEQVGYYANSNNQIVKTEDGGTTWTVVGSVSLYFTDILFEDANTGYGINELGQIFKTENGGVTWRVIFESQDVTGLYKLTKTPNNVIFAAGHNDVYDSTNYRGGVVLRREFIEER